jgi:hypothetical protein
MGHDELKDEWPRVDENGAGPDLALEDATFERERARLVRDHLGKIAVVRFNEVVGVFDTLDQATEDAHRRFGWGRMVFYLITERDEPEYIPNVDINHPSFQRLD